MFSDYRDPSDECPHCDGDGFREIGPRYGNARPIAVQCLHCKGSGLRPPTTNLAPIISIALIAAAIAVLISATRAASDSDFTDPTTPAYRSLPHYSNRY